MYKKSKNIKTPSNVKLSFNIFWNLIKTWYENLDK